MADYLWVYILGALASIALTTFLITLSKDVFLIRRLKVGKNSLVINFSLLFIALASLGLIIYLFMLIKDQINLIG